MSNNQENVWHDGEIAIQQLAGTDIKMADIGPNYIREFMPEQHRNFYESLTMIFFGYIDYNSDIYSSMLFGNPGFIQSPTKTTLVINTQQTMGDIALGDLVIGDRIGFVGIEFETKRRNRVNAIITDINQKYVVVRVLQSYGNCPKYIQPKKFTVNPRYGQFYSSSYKQLTDRDIVLIKNADVFFIGSNFNDGNQLNNRGVDNSHRGGEPGFVSINCNGQLSIEDYFGNGFYNTLGNLLLNPIANLLFCDWDNGHTIQITVTAEIIWENEQATGYQENQRVVRFTPSKIIRIENSLANLKSH